MIKISWLNTIVTIEIIRYIHTHSDNVTNADVIFFKKILSNTYHN